MASSSSASSSSRSWKYNVFLSFRGEDTRKTFVDHLYKALEDRLVHTYKDDITLPRGESVGPALLEAIEASHIAVIVFSKNYADSSWCLDELFHIMKCRAETGQIVMPIFYDVDPSDVRKQKGEFGEAFARQESENVTKSELWRKALVDASNISGWEPKNVANGHEAAVIQKIVDAISDKLLSSNCSNIDEELVGMTDRVKDLISRLEIGTGGVRMVGIWGVGGGGKTTLATCVYMEIKDRFQGQCIVANIREESSKHGRTTLQAKILSTLLKTQVVVQSEEEGKCLIKSRLCHSNVLILLDDVDDCKQLEALAGSHKWFGDGSRIIITTRDEHVLRTQKVDHISPVTLLSLDEGIRLFKKHAYNEEEPLKDYWKLSLRVISYADGLPLALKVLGSFLYDKDENGWMSTLHRLKDIPEFEIMEKLKISYDGLKKEEKEMFLDIACLYRGKLRCQIMEIFEACGFHPDIGIKVLIQKALITIRSDGNFDMHDLVQEMAYYIVRGDHPNNPEKHSRVWKHEDIDKMCIEDATTENDKIEVIDIYACAHLTPSQFVKFVSNLKKLRWIHMGIRIGNYIEGPNSLSNELRYIYWTDYPASPFPDNFQPMNLVVLKMSLSLQKELWRSHKLLPQLKVLQLRYLIKLISTPNFDGLPCLQELDLYFCKNLEEIHPSIGNHRSLKSVKIDECDNLRMFPTIFKMEKLELLKISCCHESLEFPDIQSNMESLVELSLNRIGIEGLLLSIGEKCTSLISLRLDNCFIKKSIEIDFDGLKHLKYFQIWDGCKNLKDFRIWGIPIPRSCEWIGYRFCCFGICGNTEPRMMPFDLFTEKVFHQFTHRLQRLVFAGNCLEEIPSAIGEMSNLQELDLSDNNFSNLHFSISQLTRLKLLRLSGCKRLLELPQLPSSIAILLADECDSLTDVGDFYVDCKRLCYASLIKCSNMVIDGNRFLQSMLEGETAENKGVNLKLQGLEIPKGFTPCLQDGNECTLKLPKNWCSNFYCGILMCFVAKKDDLYPRIRIIIKQVTGGLPGMDSEDDVVSDSEDDVVLKESDSEDDVVWKESDSEDGSFCSPYTCVWYIPFAWLRHTNWWDKTYKKLSFSINETTFISGFGVRLVSREGGSGATETSEEILTDSSGISDGKDLYTPGFEIEYDSKDYLQIYSRNVGYDVLLREIL